MSEDEFTYWNCRACLGEFILRPGEPCQCINTNCKSENIVQRDEE